MAVLKDFLQGKWLGHPLHPAVVHVPTALWPAALLFDLLSQLGDGNNALVRTSYFTILLGLLAALLAAASGLADFAEIKPGRPARRLGYYHMALSLAVTALFAVNLFLRDDDARQAASVSGTRLALSAAGVVLLLISGYLGGKMVYDHGAGVVRLGNSKRKWRRLAEAGGANLPPQAEKEA